MERCPTGIKGFDDICEGGFVRNSVNVLAGGPGSGKTVFLLQFLWNGSDKFYENGLYCSFEPDIIETLNDGYSFGWDFSKLNEQDKVKFLKFSPDTSVDELKKEITQLISRYNIKRICFDPITVMALNLDNEGKIRETIFDLASLMKRLKVTCVIADEIFEQDYSNMAGKKTDIIRFLADSVVTLYEGGIPGLSDRALRINKMRRTDHQRNPVGMIIDKKGVHIINPYEQALAQHQEMTKKKQEQERKKAREQARQEQIREQARQEQIREQAIQNKQSMQQNSNVNNKGNQQQDTNKLKNRENVIEGRETQPRKIYYKEHF